MRRRRRQAPTETFVAALTAMLTAVGVAGCGTGGARSSADAPPGIGVVVEIVDGDTIDADIGGRRERIRLLGIDTPEIDHPGEPGECFGDEAHRHTAALVPRGTTIRLERDIVGRDDYGRLLAYVYRSDDGMLVNERIVADGYATPLIIEPNVAGRAGIVSAARRAQAGGLGLWAACRN